MASIQQFDIGIMPLDDSPWERGKCGYKLIQCMACGVPVVASPVGVNAEIVEHGRNGFLATGGDDWYVALSKLLTNHEDRCEMGGKGRRKVESWYSKSVQGPRLVEAVRSAAGC